MDAVIVLAIVGEVVGLPATVGLLAHAKRRNGFVWGISYAVISFLVGYWIEPRPALISYGVGLFICLIPTVIVLGFMKR